jgi:hypothetical protein
LDVVKIDKSPSIGSPRTSRVLVGDHQIARTGVRHALETSDQILVVDDARCTDGTGQDR